MARCKTCQQEIVWGKTESGRRIPLDRPEKRFIRADLMAEHYADEDDYIMVDTHLSHFATCPQADLHRKEKTDG
ncbi:MAG: hypothetical protein IH921_06910 [Gemmatimonadetes bacterium]|nr:hypothetical protein [Gemmatimonadota bacterium]